MLSDKLRSTGIADTADIQAAWPSEERLKKGRALRAEGQRREVQTGGMLDQNCLKRVRPVVYSEIN